MFGTRAACPAESIGRMAELVRQRPEKLARE